MKSTANPAALALLSLNIEPAADGQSVLLEQDTGGRVHRISLHASQVTAVAQFMDLAGTEVERLHRALLRSWEMAARLRRSLGITSDFGQEDLAAEVGLSTQLEDFLAFICADFDERYGPLPSALPTPAPAEDPAPVAAPPSSARPPMLPVAPLPPRATSQQRAAFEQGCASAGELFTQGAKS